MKTELTAVFTVQARDAENDEIAVTFTENEVVISYEQTRDKKITCHHVTLTHQQFASMVRVGNQFARSKSEIESAVGGIAMRAAHEIDTANEYGGSQHSTHRSPRAAGSADRYYSRSYNPNFAWDGQTYSEAEMTAKQKLEYDTAYWGEADRKDWGGDAEPCDDNDGEDS